jgi:hypothetical protein
MTEMAPYVLIGWIVLAVALFRLLPPHRAVLVIFIGGMLFLPEVQGFSPTHTSPPPLILGGFRLVKLFVPCYSVFLAALLFDRARWLAFRPRWFDVPMLVWCLSPLLSSLSNDLGLHDGLTQVIEAILLWGGPYLIGRVYFPDAERLRDLAVGVVLGGVVYIPLCLYESVMGPTVHPLLYGFVQHDVGQSPRWGGFRPFVFLEHGLAVGMWMTVATLLAYTLARDDNRPEFRLPRWLAFAALLVTAVLCRSAFALALGLAGLTVLSPTYRRRPLLLVVLVAVAPTYVILRTVGAPMEDTLGWVASTLGPERARSLAYRLQNETALLDHARERLWFGWGAWGRADTFIDTEYGRRPSVADGLWILTLGNRGLWGLIALYSALLVPALRFALLRPPPERSRSTVGLLAGWAVVGTLFAIDGLMNNMANQVILLGIGGLSATIAARPQPVDPGTDVDNAPAPEMARPGILRRPSVTSLPK